MTNAHNQLCGNLDAPGRRGLDCRRILVRAFVAFAMAVSACSAQSPQRAAAISHQAPLGVWEYPASEFPTMCIAFLPDGELRFRGGFLFFNPGRWEGNGNDGTVRMTLGGASPFPFRAPREQLAHRVGTMVSAIPDQRVLVYRLSADTTSLEFGGFIFYRKAACTAD